MKHRLRNIALSLLLCAALIGGFTTPVFAANPASDYGVVLTKGKWYTKDGRYYMPFTLQTGQVPYADDPSTSMVAELFNSSGKSIFKWDRKFYSHNGTTTREPNFPLGNLASDTYTMKVTVGIWEGSRCDYTWDWTYNVNYKVPSSIYLDSAAVITRDDGSYANRIKLGHSGCNGKFAHIEIYDEWGNLVMSGQGNKAISNNKGIYSFTWGGFPKGGGLRCESGHYTIKFWVTGGNPKQSTVWLDIY